MLLTILLLAAQTLPADACEKHPLGWSCKATWIGSLPRQEQEDVLTVLKGALNIEVRDRLTPNVKTQSDACWASSVAAMGDDMLSMAATKTPALKAYFEYSSRIVRRMNSRQLTGSEAQTLLAAHPMPVERTIAAKGRVQLIERRYKAQVLSSESALLAFSKVAVTQMGICKTTTD
jgi:hypothetical protein